MFGAMFFSRQFLFISLVGNIALITVLLAQFEKIGQIDIALPYDFYASYRHDEPLKNVVPPINLQLDMELEKVGATGPAAPQCSMCAVAPELCAEIGRDKLERGVSFMGSNKRLKRALRKMRTGKPWVMGVIGGSGHGLPYGSRTHPPYHPKYRRPNMHRVIFDHLDARFPADCPTIQQALDAAEAKYTPEAKEAGALLVDVAAVEGTLDRDVGAITEPLSRAYGFSAREKGVNSMINGAQGATGSGYFAYCFAEHIPEDADIIIVEQAINDERNVWSIDTYENLIRVLLDLPNKPAIITVETFALMFQSMAMGGDMHKGLNEYYDLPSLSIRNSFMPDTFHNISMVAKYFHRNRPDENPPTLEGIDTRHISGYLHEKAGQFVNAYIDTAICFMKAEEGDKPLVPLVEDDVDPLPRLRLNAPFDMDTETPSMRPSCFSTTSLTHKLVPSANEGWTEWAWKEKKYWIATEPGSKISFNIKVGVGKVNIMYQRSATFGLGNVICYVEGQEGWTKQALQGYWPAEYNLLQSAAFTGVQPGDQVVTCVLQEGTADPKGGHEFRIASITSV